MKVFYMDMYSYPVQLDKNTWLAFVVAVRGI